MKTKEILGMLDELKKIAWYNKNNSFSKNDEKTHQAVIDFLNKEWKDVESEESE